MLQDFFRQPFGTSVAVLVFSIFLTGVVSLLVRYYLPKIAAKATLVTAALGVLIACIAMYAVLSSRAQQQRALQTAQKAVEQTVNAAAGQQILSRGLTNQDSPSEGRISELMRELEAARQTGKDNADQVQALRAQLDIATSELDEKQRRLDQLQRQCGVRDGPSPISTRGSRFSAKLINRAVTKASGAQKIVSFDLLISNLGTSPEKCRIKLDLLPEPAYVEFGGIRYPNRSRIEYAVAEELQPVMLRSEGLNLPVKVAVPAPLRSMVVRVWLVGESNKSLYREFPVKTRTE